VQTGVVGNLARDFHVLAIDARGHGNSGKPHDPKAYGAEMAADVVRLLDHVKIRRAHIVGYSMGVRLVEKLLTSDPDRFLTATFGGFGAGRNWSADDDRQMERRAVEADHGSFRSLLLSVAPTDGRQVTEQAIEETSRMFVQDNDPLALAAVTRNLRGLAVTDAQMAAVRVPTLAVVGGLDPQLALVTQLKKVMPSLKVVVAPGAVHDSADPRGTPRRPEFVTALRQFVTAHQSGSTH
jgi:pimeloyl-ACP methyl ester carboxylesterase